VTESTSVASLGLDEFFRRFAEGAGIPGLAFGVVAGGQLVHQGRSGVADQAGGHAVQEGTAFRIASMTKSFTAACVLTLRDRGLLALDDPLERHLPEAAALALEGADDPRITLRHLLTMTAGFVEDDPWADRQLALPAGELLRLLQGGVALSRGPGEAFEYSNLGYALLGQVVQRVSGEPLAELAREVLLEPLGMRDSTFDFTSLPAARRARGYRRDGPQYVEEPPLGDGAFGAMGGLWTTVEDFARYVIFQLAAWEQIEAPPPLLQSSSRREMQRGHIVVPPRDHPSPGGGPSGYGLGLFVAESAHPGRVVYHGGGLPGFGSHVQWLPHHGLGVFAFSNLTYASLSRPVFEALELVAGTLPATAPETTPEWSWIQERVSSLYEGGGSGAWAEIAADNLLLDRPAGRRAEELRDLRQRLGPVLVVAPPVLSGGLRATWRLSCERGELEVECWLAPPRPARVQVLRFRTADPPEPA
jgi:D-alanyl-D-alanine-carboxypeptidase/D-alanyl-D-alanine-endopeptidase